MDAELPHHHSEAHLMVAFDDAEIIVERVNIQFCRPVVGVDRETAATADGPRCIVWTRKVRLDSDVPVAAVALAEVRRSLAAVEFVIGRAGGIDDICPDE